MATSTLRVGVDMVNIRQLRDMIETSGPTFLDSCWTSAEQTYCAGSVERLAARWAAKEATMKVLGHGIGEVDPIDIEVYAVEGERPDLHLHGTAAGYALEMELGPLALSLTHEANFALALVAACGTSSGPLNREGIITELAHGTADGQLSTSDGFSSRPMNQEGGAS